MKDVKNWNLTKRIESLLGKETVDRTSGTKVPVGFKFGKRSKR